MIRQEFGTIEPNNPTVYLVGESKGKLVTRQPNLSVSLALTKLALSTQLCCIIFVNIEYQRLCTFCHPSATKELYSQIFVVQYH